MTEQSNDNITIEGPEPNFKFGPKACLNRSSDKTLNFDVLPKKLKWDEPPKNILVIKKKGDPNVNQCFCDIIDYLISEQKMNICIEKAVFSENDIQEKFLKCPLKAQISTYERYKCDLTNKIDFIVCLGGDGTLLYASTLFQESVPPIMAFHLGSLGFLAPFDFTNYKKDLNKVLQGNSQLVLRSRLKCTVNIKQEASKTAPKHIMVLNEIVIDRGISPYLSAIELYIGHQLITVVQGDGLIIATPTGSTAYACAAGASMVHPGIPAIIITPICPHSLSFRPIIVPAGAVIKIALSPQARGSAWMSFDGQYKQEIKLGDSLYITTSVYPVPCVCLTDQIHDWFNALEKSLHWNQREIQKKLT